MPCSILSRNKSLVLTGDDDGTPCKPFTNKEATDTASYIILVVCCQEKPKRMKVVVDVSGSMYRFNGHDQRLERMLESALMVMEALYGFDDRFKYDIVGHSGEDNNIPFVLASKAPENEKQRLQVSLF